MAQLKEAELALEKCARKTYDIIYEEAYDDFDYGAWGNSHYQTPAEQETLAQQRYLEQEEKYQAALTVVTATYNQTHDYKVVP